MSMNRASDAAAFDWITTGSLADLKKAADLIAARLAVLQSRDQEIAAQTGSVPVDASPFVFHNFGFAGMARYLERQGMNKYACDTSDGKPVGDVDTAKVAPTPSNAKPAIKGLDIDSSISRAGLRFAR